MSSKDNLKEVAHHIKTEYPELNFENVSVSDICNIIFKKNNYHELRKSIVNAMNEKLHLLISTLKL
ncbi:DDE Tnp4 domain-containing protein [Aphis craccivora]|uniref:DDE Tnp4 domain-containing protein n=1 Tax=Aphis craccivora TaxID=307492 RepID=A0A6G0Y0C1_APHCR|nr:DDE Tnp4 domain-containing protein [Aphis craccivora]